ncbi:MAG: hypothetical protein WA093_01990 [Minisyncoccales bacterium]
MDVLFLLLLLVGIIVSVAGYNWYINHGGTKKWLKWLAFLPFVAAVVIVLAFLAEVIFMGLGQHNTAPAGHAVMDIVSAPELVLNVVIFILFCLLTLNAIISPIISSRWYIKH